ncbi:helix-turn-helix transcriptional regulator [Schinkia azotoformans]|uniref:helix-turn-helix domain-containing protein n=1 Tax=Schinkia azotoformans TaxID=1454 RepID=UPI002E23D999|nr:helix-turn-helix transcriptional regulator [Schinkia azotoformans]
MFTPEDFKRNTTNIRSVLLNMGNFPLHHQLRVKRVADKLSSTRLSHHLQMGLSTLSDIEAGRRRIPLKHQKKIENYLYREYWCDGEYVGPIEQ